MAMNNYGGTPIGNTTLSNNINSISNTLLTQQNIVAMNSTQKVAALLILLGPVTAAEVLKNITDNDLLEQIALEIASLNKVPVESLVGILEEFRSLFQASRYLAKGGKDYAKQVLELTYGPEQAKRIMARLEAMMNANPFQFFNEADPVQLATSFQNENPQLIALILAYLQPAQSARVLNNLTPEVQAQVAIKIADMDTTNPEILADIEKIVETKFSSVMVQDFSQAGGIDTLASILNRSDRQTERNVLELLEIENPTLADEVRELMFVFEDIITLDDRTIQRVLREVNTKDLALSLKGTKEEVREKIFKNMSERAQKMLRDDMEYLGPVRAKEVQDVQASICATIKALEAAGAFAIVLECVPAKLAEIITAKVAVPTIGIGAGAGCDGQVLVYQDMLGMYDNFTPKFVRKFAEVGAMMKQGVQEYCAAVQDSSFPAAEHTFKIDEEVLEKLY